MYFIGVDHHKQASVMTVLDEAGRELKNGRVFNLREKSEKSFLNSPCFLAIQSGRPWILAIAFLLGLFTKELTALIVPMVVIPPVPRRRVLLLALVPGMVMFLLFVILYRPEPEATFWSTRLITGPK